MLTLLRTLLAPNPPRLSAPDARLALAALLVRVARSDGHYSAPEVAHIDATLRARHGLSDTAAAYLRTEAEAIEAEAPDTVRFTRALKEAVPIEDRTALVQALWTVALADGHRDAEEDRMLRLITNLLGLTDVESAQARQRAQKL
jgi:uncharacterized tellurite resistance protein B-like protein